MPVYALDENRPILKNVKMRANGCNEAWVLKKEPIFSEFSRLWRTNTQ
jgi:hypothetical protein